MGHQARWEYFGAIYERYHKGDRKLKHIILNEFCLNIGTSGRACRQSGLMPELAPCGAPRRRKVRLPGGSSEMRD